MQRRPGILRPIAPPNRDVLVRCVYSSSGGFKYEDKIIECLVQACGMHDPVDQPEEFTVAHGNLMKACTERCGNEFVSGQSEFYTDFRGRNMDRFAGWQSSDQDGTWSVKTVVKIVYPNSTKQTRFFHSQTRGMMADAMQRMVEASMAEEVLRASAAQFVDNDGTTNGEVDIGGDDDDAALR
jgi:hypothetical protein